MKKIIIIAGFLMFANLDLHAQTCNATGAQINSSLQVVKNIKTDFGAIGNGVVNDHAAFEAAATFINNTDGNVKLIIPDGIYLVGKQIAHLTNTATEIETVYQGIPAMFLENVSNVTIQGSKYTQIIYENSLKFGTFETYYGTPPTELDFFNGPIQGPGNPNGELKYQGTIGTFLQIIGGNNIEVKDMEINGNNDNYSLGGNWGLGPRPIELNYSFGFFLFDISNATFSNLRIHHFGGDNFYLGSNTNGQGVPTPVTNNILIDRLVVEYSGRQGFTWAGGENVCIYNSSFNHAANTEIKTKPGYGLDIEPEQAAVPVCRNSFFEGCHFGYNMGLALTTGESKDNLPLPGHNPPGYTYNHYFFDCILIGENVSTTHNYANRVTFDECRFYGHVLNYASSVNNAHAPAIYKNSYFSDCYNGKRMVHEPLLSMELSHKTQFINNVFKRYFSSGDFSWVFHYVTSAFPCDSNNYKPLFENNSFYYYPAPTASTQYASNSRRSLFINNHFHKYNSTLINWNIPMDCPPVGEGNFEPNGTGTGVIEHNDITTSPQCADKLICERDIYTSNDIENSEFYQASSFIYTDSKIDLDGTENVKYQSAESINMNPGFESVLVGSAYIDLYIAPCTLASGRTINEAPPKVKGISTTLSETVEKQSLAVYPNPSENDFIVDFNNAAGKRVEYVVTDALGHVIERSFFNISQSQSSTFRIKTIHKAGIYFLTINFGDRSETKKLIRL